MKTIATALEKKAKSLYNNIIGVLYPRERSVNGLSSRKQLRIGMVGFGSMGKTHAYAIRN